MSKIKNNGVFVYTVLTSTTAGLGDASTDDGNGFVLKNEISGVVKIPSYIDGYMITELLYRSIRNCPKITRLILPKNLEVINSVSLTMVQGISELVFPASLVKIGDRCDVFFCC